MRPKFFYVVIEHGAPIQIVQGSVLARRLHAYQRPFKTEQAAQEWAAWWCYDMRHKFWWINKIVFRSTTE